MTISSNISEVFYAGNGGSGPFGFRGPVYNDAEITVKVRLTSGTTETTLVQGSEYTIADAITGLFSGGPYPNGINIFDYALASGYTLVIKRDVELDQQTRFIENAAFPAAANETGLDKLTLICQQLARDLAKCIRLQDTIQSTGTVTLPIAETGHTLVWAADGNLENSTLNIEDIDASLADAVADAVASATASANAAASSASSASTSASTATTQASNASSSASSASTSASTATIQATNASNSATAAAASAAAAQAVGNGVLTTKGDLVVRNSTTAARLPVGSNNQVLVADSAQTLGVKWAAASNVDIQTFIANGTTWTKPTGSFTLAFVICIGAGGGGGGGACWSTALNSDGGGGGAGGAYTESWLQFSTLASTETITMDTNGGGSGGLNGNNAGNAGNTTGIGWTSFGSWLYASSGGAGGGGGGSVAGTAGVAGTSGLYLGSNGTAGAPGGGTNAANATNSLRAGAGGGGGGGSNTASADSDGGNGGAPSSISTGVYTGGTTVGAAGQNATAQIIGEPGFGGGGGAGGNASTRGGRGGSSSGFGGGGGGGGGTKSASGFNGGDGGIPGTGLVVVICM